MKIIIGIIISLIVIIIGGYFLSGKMSDDILDSFQKINEGIESTIKTPENASDFLYKEIEKNYSSTEVYVKAMLLKSASDLLVNDIHQLKNEIIGLTKGKVDDYEVPTKFLINEGNATILKEKIKAHEKVLIDLMENDSIIINSFTLIEDFKEESWEISLFYQVPMAACLAMLSKIEFDIRFNEMECLSYLYERSNEQEKGFIKIAPL